MKKLLLAALAATLLGACAHDPSAPPREPRAKNDDYVSVGSNIPRKKSPSGSRVGTATAEDLDEARMGAGR